jgi:DNA-binding MarR family transcriptional regulator
VLSQAAARDKSTLTPVVREFVERGLVTRTPIESDRRSHALELTPKGLRLWRELKGHSIAVDEKLAQIVGPENRQMFLEILRRIRAELHVPAIAEDDGT